MTLNLRLAEKSDEPFLYQLYCTTRHEEMVVWGWDTPQQELFLKLQYQAQQQHYRQHYATADHHIIEWEATAIGQLLVWRTATEIRLVDITLLPAYHNQGIGTTLIQALLGEVASQAKPVRLSVASGNRAKDLYERLGFVILDSDGVYFLMEKR
jgi:ribosomal protein S18 acetylase RimI-like enzyme